MKVKIIRSCFVDGKSVEAGKTVDVEERTARILIGSKKAVIAPAPEKKAESK